MTTPNKSDVASKAYVISGVPIVFPYKAYPSQITMMDRIVKSLNKGNNCLLESPTGSGKSLALLCASLSWLNQTKKRMKEFDEKYEQYLSSMGITIEDNIVCQIHGKKNGNNDCEKGPESIHFPENPSDSFSNLSNGEPLILRVEASVRKENETVDDQKTAKLSDSCKRNSISFHNEEFEDFAPSKRYRKSLDVTILYKLGSNNNSAVHNKKLSRYQPNKSPSTSDNTSSRFGSNNNFTVGDKQLPCDKPNNTSVPSTSDDKVSSIDSASKENLFCTCDRKKELSKLDGADYSNLPTKLPTIYFGTRTHRQIQQIIRELKKTVYKDCMMTILSSRERTCIHPDALQADNKNEACDELLKAEGGPACKFFRNSKMISHCHPNKLSTAFDLEDFVTICKKARCCPYFGSRELLSTADIVFCPYNYLVDPLIRSALSINLKGSILIMDEAHNIEDTAREATSASFNVASLEECAFNLEKVGRSSRTGRELYFYFCDILKCMSNWLKNHSSNLTDYMTFESSSKVYEGDDMLAVLSYIKIGPDTFKEFKQKFEKLLSIESDKEQAEIKDLDEMQLPSSSVSILKGLIEILSYLYKDNMVFVPDYRLVISRSRQFGQRQRRGNRHVIVPADQLEISFNFWCLNPAVAFSDFKDCIRSLIVASGTLSPMTSFQSELNTIFHSTLEANHVINKSQLWIGTIGRGPNNVSMNAKFENAGTFAFQDDVGLVISQICSIIPHGVLCFLPSYSLMEKLINRWEQTGLFEELLNKKVVLCEPRRIADFQSVMEEFYDAISCSKNGTGKGALFFAVCRGKVSEGLDFADENARAVITVGIPFPNVKDAQVDLKKKFNDKYSSKRNILSGSEWYEIQAFRAINQALGRCIRHRDDFGALVIIDERFQKNMRYQNSLSKWIRKDLEHFASCKDALASLTVFANDTGLKVLD